MRINLYILRKKSLLLFLALVFILNAKGFSQPFTENTPLGLNNYLGEALWIDYDSDGDLDLYLSGTRGSGQDVSIYSNSAGSFTELPNDGLTELRGSSCWADLNNDGFLDAVRVGIQGGNENPKVFSFITINNGDGTFTELNLPNNDAYRSADIALNDFNNDGLIDILIVGFNILGLTEAGLYTNNDGISFTKVTSHSIPGISGSMNVGDYDLDGDLDILLSGKTSDWTSYVSVFRNENNFEFDEVAIDIGSTPFENVSNWGDINGDGYLDVISTGRVLNDNFSLSVSVGSSSGFSPISNTGLDEISFSAAVQFLDYDNNGSLDVLLSGEFVDGYSVKLFSNNNNLTFSEISETGFLSSRSLDMDFGDYDLDGDLDIVSVGYSLEYSPVTKIYDNNGSSNSDPSIPTNLQSTIDERNISLSWSSSSDTETSLASITYNVRVGTESNYIDIITPNASLSNGVKYSSSSGNAGFNEFINLNNLDNGTYYWSVQAIDNGLNSSNFSQEGSFDIFSLNNTPTAPSHFSGSFLIDESIKLVWNDLSYNETSFEIERAIGINGSFELLSSVPANSSQYKDTSIFNNETYVYRLSAMNGSLSSNSSGEVTIDTPKQGFFSRSDTLLLTMEGFNTVSLSIIDYNNDGLQDIFTLNIFDKGSLYKNLGDNTYVKIENNELVNLEAQVRTATWGDINNDGFPDVFITKTQNNFLFLNNGDDSFTRIANLDFISSLDSNGATWGDINSDGFIDLYVANYSSQGELYLNNQDNSFTLVETGDISMDMTDGTNAVFLDINNDLHVDLFAGTYFGNNLLYFNDQTGELVNQVNNEVSSSSASTVGSSWADYDNDGDFDVLVTNNVNTQDEFYENDGQGNFNEVFNLITNSYIKGSSSAWLDFDNDGWEDIIMVTNNSKVLFRNLGNQDFELIDEYTMSTTPYSTSVSVADFNQDGFQDIVVGNSSINNKNEYFINNTNSNNWLDVRAIGQSNNKSALGSKIRVFAGELALTKQVFTNSGANSQSGFINHFGLGSNDIAKIEIHWPNNGIQVLKEVSVNQSIGIEEVALPKHPSEFMLTRILYNELGFSWADNSDGEIGFIIYRTVIAGNSLIAIDSVGSNITSYLDTTVSSSSDYKYTVRAYSDDGTSFDSNTLEVMTPPAPPVAPANLEIIIISGREVNLSWTDNSDNEEGYILERSELDNSNYIVFDTVLTNVINFTDLTVTEGQTYYYRVRAYNISGTSNYSNEIFGSPITGIFKFEKSVGFDIYPNPASSGQYYIKIKNDIIGSGVLTVRDLNGRELYSVLLNKKSEILEVQLENLDLKSGSYLLNLIISKSTFYAKLIIE